MLFEIILRNKDLHFDPLVWEMALNMFLHYPRNLKHIGNENKKHNRTSTWSNVKFSKLTLNKMYEN